MASCQPCRPYSTYLNPKMSCPGGPESASKARPGLLPTHIQAVAKGALITGWWAEPRPAVPRVQTQPHKRAGGGKGEENGRPGRLSSTRSVLRTCLPDHSGSTFVIVRGRTYRWLSSFTVVLFYEVRHWIKRLLSHRSQGKHRAIFCTPLDMFCSPSLVLCVFLFEIIMNCILLKIHCWFISIELMGNYCISYLNEAYPTHIFSP